GGSKAPDVAIANAVTHGDDLLMGAGSRFPHGRDGAMGRWSVRLGAVAGVYLLLHSVGLDLPFSSPGRAGAAERSAVLVTAVSANTAGPVAPVPGAGRAPTHSAPRPRAARQDV